MNCNKNTLRSDAGFTLIELMIAIAVMAILALLSWRSLDNMSQMQTQMQSKTDNVMTLQAGLAQWQVDLDMIWEVPQIPNINPMDFDGQVLRLVRRFTENNTEIIRVVAWSQREKNGKQQWLRWQSDPVKTRSSMLAAWQQATQWAQSPSETDKAHEVAIATVDQWQIFYYRNDTWSNSLSSADTVTPGTKQAELPDGVRLILTLPEGEPIQGKITRDWLRPTLGGGKS
ncbi:MAG TPA: prepilin-type N-terminal cleavage/methylation domain-containing protein [Burkholderiaceae bacterium]|nr:prepilin-type N-terminal cleavage/methylation domain-containing protein [Burkholderiaceae bacterium]